MPHLVPDHYRHPGHGVVVIGVEEFQHSVEVGGVVFDRFGERLDKLHYQLRGQPPVVGRHANKNEFDL